MCQFLHQNIFERLAHFDLKNSFLLFVKVQGFGNFGSHYFHEIILFTWPSQIFEKQLGKLPHLQFLSSVALPCIKQLMIPESFF
jgi:hypothetical protein